MGFHDYGTDVHIPFQVTRDGRTEKFECVDYFDYLAIDGKWEERRLRLSRNR